MSSKETIVAIVNIVILTGSRIMVGTSFCAYPGGDYLDYIQFIMRLTLNVVALSPGLGSSVE